MAPDSDHLRDERGCPRCGRQLPPDAPGGNCPACLWALAAAAEETSPIDEGPHRFGSYELVEELARGGMGVVWRARQEGLDRDVALKMILAGHLATSSQVVRFYTEARAAARLDHPGIVPIYEIGEEEGRHYYTMMLMEGRSLAEALRGRAPPSPEEAAALVLAAARAIHFAHQRGVLHRDVKPSNILLDGEGRPRIADFGLARLADGDSGFTRSNALLGTPAYMAPEQASGPSGEVTTAVDVYGLGAVLHELLTGSPPFRGATPLETLRLLLTTEARSPRARNPRVDRDLAVICLKCLQKQPERRYASAGDLADDLERWTDGRPIRARPASALERMVSWARRKRELAKALAALLVVVFIALAVTVALLVKVRRESAARAAALRSEEGQRLAFQSLAVVGENPGQALLLALEAAERAPSLSARNALVASMAVCRERRRLLGHERMVRFASFSPDGGRVVTAAHDDTARIWSVETGEATGVLRGHGGVVRTAVFSPDGSRVVTASDDATARVWSSETGALLFTLTGHENPLRSARFSPDGERVVTVAQRSARIWDSRSGRAIHVIGQHADGITCGRFSPDGRRVVTGGRDGAAKVWDVQAGTLLATLADHAGRVIDIAFSRDGNRVATASVPEAHVWDAATYEELSIARGHAYEVYSVALTSDGARLATGSEDFTARIWDARTGEEIHRLSHGHKVVSVEISPDDSLLLTASYDKTAKVWDLATGAQVAEMRGHAAPLYHGTFSPDGRLVATSSVDYTARLWTVDALLPLALGTRRAAKAISIDVAADGRSMVEALAGEKAAAILDVGSSREIARLVGHEGDVTVVRYSPDGATVASGSADATARLWDARTGEALHVLSGHQGAVVRVGFSPDSRRVVTVSEDQSARLWNVADGMQAAAYDTGSQIYTATFAPDSDRLALADAAGWLRIARLSTGELTVFDVDDPIVAADFGPEGWEIALAVGTTRSQIRSLADRRLAGVLVHPARSGYLVLSPDRRWIATLAQDAVVRLWDATSREERLEIKRGGALPLGVHFPADGRRVVVRWAQAGVRDEVGTEAVVYPLDVMETARAARFGELTPDERDLFGVGTPEERRDRRRAWTDGHIFGPEPAAKRSRTKTP